MVEISLEMIIGKCAEAQVLTKTTVIDGRSKMRED